MNYILYTAVSLPTIVLGHTIQIQRCSCIQRTTHPMDCICACTSVGAHILGDPQNVQLRNATTDNRNKNCVMCMIRKCMQEYVRLRVCVCACAWLMHNNMFTFTTNGVKTRTYSWHDKIGKWGPKQDDKISVKYYI